MDTLQMKLQEIVRKYELKGDDLIAFSTAIGFMLIDNMALAMIAINDHSLASGVVKAAAEARAEIYASN